MKKRCHSNWIARNIVDKPIQRPIRLEISKIRIFEVQNVRWLKLSRHKPDIKQTFSREIEQNYSFLFDIIWNDKLRVSRTSFKFESNIIESRIYHVIYPKNVTWRVTWPTTTHVKHPKDQIGLQEIFSRTIFKMKMLNKPSAPKLKRFSSSGLTWFFKSESPG